MVTARFAVLAISLIALFAAYRWPLRQPYDLLIRGGRIVDGSGNPWFIGDVAVRGERIVAVGRIAEPEAKRTIDATGLVVAPGFIDMHSHSDLLLLEDGHAQSKIRQGVTTEVLGEGSSAGPYKGKLTPRSTTIDGTGARVATLGDYFDALEKSGTSRQRAPATSAWTTSGNASWASRTSGPRRSSSTQMKELLDEAMQRRRVRPVDHAGHAARLAGHDRRPGRAVQGRRAARRHLLDAQPQRRDRRVRRGQGSDRRSASGPACRSTSSTSRSPTRSTGAG